MAVKIAQPSPSSQVVTMPPVKYLRRNLVSRQSISQPGSHTGDGADMHGGGGPENYGARSDASLAAPFYEARPAWSHEDNLLSEYVGYAAPSKTPNLAGIPANNFRHLGDNHGGRQ